MRTKRASASSIERRPRDVFCFLVRCGVSFHSTDRITGEPVSIGEHHTATGGHVGWSVWVGGASHVDDSCSRAKDHFARRVGVSAMRSLLRKKLFSAI